MPINTTKIFNDNGEYVTLFDLSKTYRYSLEYLLNAASRGKLKSFKVGDEWVTTLAWFDDYKKSIKRAIQVEISGKETESKKDWIDFAPENTWSLRFIPQLVLLLVIFSVLSFSLSWLIFSTTGHRMASSADNLVAKRYIMDDYFLHYTNQVYNYNYQYFSYVIDNSLNSISLLTGSLVSFGQNTAYLALALDQSIGSYKVSDEIITEKMNELADILRNKYQAVAGTSSIATQIYFDAWQKSIKSGN